MCSCNTCAMICYFYCHQRNRTNVSRGRHGHGHDDSLESEQWLHCPLYWAYTRSGERGSHRSLRSSDATWLIWPLPCPCTCQLYEHALTFSRAEFVWAFWSFDESRRRCGRYSESDLFFCTWKRRNVICRFWRFGQSRIVVKHLIVGFVGWSRV